MSTHAMLQVVFNFGGKVKKIFSKEWETFIKPCCSLGYMCLNFQPSRSYRKKKIVCIPSNNCSVGSGSGPGSLVSSGTQTGLEGGAIEISLQQLKKKIVLPDWIGFRLKWTTFERFWQECGNIWAAFHISLSLYTHTYIDEIIDITCENLHI